MDNFAVTPTVAMGAGHQSVILLPGKDANYFGHHRLPLGDRDGRHCVKCIARMEFDEQGSISPAKITLNVLGGLNIEMG